jgi:hypothetical protein
MPRTTAFSYFAFDLSDALIAAVRTGSARPLLERYGRFEREVPGQRYSTFLRNHLLGTRLAERLTVGADGHIGGYVPFATLAPLEAIILELVRTP